MVVSEGGGENPLDHLFSSETGDSEIWFVRFHDKGSQPPCVSVEVQGVKTHGIVDTGVDITIIGGDLFKKVARITPYTYDDKPITPVGQFIEWKDHDHTSVCQNGFSRSPVVQGSLQATQYYHISP